MGAACAASRTDVRGRGRRRRRGVARGATISARTRRAGRWSDRRTGTRANAQEIHMDPAGQGRVLDHGSLITGQLVGRQCAVCFKIKKPLAQALNRAGTAGVRRPEDGRRGGRHPGRRQGRRCTSRRAKLWCTDLISVDLFLSDVSLPSAHHPVAPLTNHNSLPAWLVAETLTPRCRLSCRFREACLTYGNVLQFQQKTVSLCCAPHDRKGAACDDDTSPAQPGPPCAGGMPSRGPCSVL